MMKADPTISQESPQAAENYSRKLGPAQSVYISLVSFLLTDAMKVTAFFNQDWRII